MPNNNEELRKEAEEAASNYTVGKDAAIGGTIEQKLNRINIAHAYKDGYIACAQSRRSEIEQLRAMADRLADALEMMEAKVMGSDMFAGLPASYPTPFFMKKCNEVLEEYRSLNTI